MIEAGKKVEASTRFLIKSTLTESVPGCTYEIRIATRGIPDEEKAAVILVDTLRSKFNAKTNWIRIEGNTIRMQIEGSPFAWALLLAFLPDILLGVGVVVLLISVFLLITTSPYVAASIVLGLGLILLAFAAGHPAKKTVQTMIRGAVA